MDELFPWINFAGILLSVALTVIGLVQSYRRYARNENVADALALNERLSAENDRLRRDNTNLRAELEKSDNEKEWLRRLITTAGIVINDGQVHIGGDMIANDKMEVRGKTP